MTELDERFLWALGSFLSIPKMCSRSNNSFHPGRHSEKDDLHTISILVMMRYATALAHPRCQQESQETLLPSFSWLMVKDVNMPCLGEGGELAMMQDASYDFVSMYIRELG